MAKNDNFAENIIPMQLSTEIKLLQPSHWKDYELIDSGNFEKLERFGKYVLSRPEPQAVWSKSLKESEWNSLFHAQFKKGKDYDSSEKGEWLRKKEMPEQWFINYQYKEMNLRFRLGFNTFKHIGIFPEQAENWNYIYDRLKLNNAEKPNVLNLFAYTGAASLAAKAAGADVVHVDSVKQVVNWSRENMEISSLKDIRWVVEDALKFAQREVKRGNKYSGIILDPPAYGRGPEGEKWILEKHINELISLCSSLLKDQESFLILNLYSLGFSALISDNIINSYFTGIKEKEIGEFFIGDKYSKRLPLGTFVRFSR